MTDNIDLLIAGLGNPGDKFTNTRHNVGFMAIDALGDTLGASYWQDKCEAQIASVTYGDYTIMLAKPQTYMNESGRAVKGLCKTYGLSPSNVLVIHDDLDLPAHQLRFKMGGGNGGHNGIKSIVAAIGADFARLKIGTGRPPGRMEAYDYVLQQLKGDALEEQRVDGATAADAALFYAENGLIKAQDKYN
ncbi:MAG: aminoacyl-tRNA hydrolase [Coriobacteriales bacterium]|jgi:PTH1 family peptidyl-tRNA hydrolase|nr:aminoacyl-tRNA hydrolase [Coriobacteriales bacterium]